MKSPKQLRYGEAMAFDIESGSRVLTVIHYAPQPNETFNADANIGHRFAILMANVGALRASRSGAG
jgi:hypothetical protein